VFRKTPDGLAPETLKPPVPRSRKSANRIYVLGHHKALGFVRDYAGKKTPWRVVDGSPCAFRRNGPWRRVIPRFPLEGKQRPNIDNSLLMWKAKGPSGRVGEVSHN